MLKYIINLNIWGRIRCECEYNLFIYIEVGRIFSIPDPKLDGDYKLISLTLSVLSPHPLSIGTENQIPHKIQELSPSL